MNNSIRINKLSAVTFPLSNYLASVVMVSAALCSTNLSAASSFNEVKDVIFGEPAAATSNKIAQEQAVYSQDLLPRYEVSVAKFLAAGFNQLAQDSRRTLRESADYLPRLEKLVHSNGICFSGTWRITEPTEYSGYFQTGAAALFIGRASTALTATKRGTPRAFGFAGKIFRTTDPNEAVETANFFTVDVLSGVHRERFMDVRLTNEPPTGFRAGVAFLGLVVSSTFASADRNPGFRPLHPIAELGLKNPAEAKWPRYLMLQTDPRVPRNNGVDFRDELDLEENETGVLRLQILVSEETSNKNSNSWTQIGEIDLNESTVSYGCDRQLHFSHPKLK